jgi:hypothetical protein
MVGYGLEDISVETVAGQVSDEGSMTSESTESFAAEFPDCHFSPYVWSKQTNAIENINSEW